MNHDPDIVLTYRVIARIVGDPALRRQRITVEVQDRVVTLLGKVPSVQARLVAADLVRHTPGVRDLCNRLRAGGRAEPDAFDQLVSGW
ncbi:BON domain-containing protein [Actinoplanes sp. NPDC023714]|uniref:BON domain-containing protein n=1 Tax=Actinoplanes sp. NPDC023714 TaxID=3154322 RepID=UPI0033C964D8